MIDFTMKLTIRVLMRTGIWVLGVMAGLLPAALAINSFPIDLDIRGWLETAYQEGAFRDAFFLCITISITAMSSVINLLFYVGVEELQSSRSQKQGFIWYFGFLSLICSIVLAFIGIVVAPSPQGIMTEHASNERIGFLMVTVIFGFVVEMLVVGIETLRSIRGAGEAVAPGA